MCLEGAVGTLCSLRRFGPFFEHKKGVKSLKMGGSQRAGAVWREKRGRWKNSAENGGNKSRLSWTKDVVDNREPRL